MKLHLIPSKRKKRKNILRKSLFLHTKITFTFFIFYLIVSLVADPRFLMSDFREKYSSIAATSQTLLSLHMIGPPRKPIFSAAWHCNSSGSHIRLAWNATEDTTDYDIYKDSVILASGITDLDYRDDIITENTSYVYQVVANGPLGATSSDEVTVTAEHCETRPTPAIQIKNLDGRNIEGIALPEITSHSPIFSGTTSIPNALIAITVESGPVISSSTVANSNGYWEWQVPISLNYGNHTATFTATDPNDEAWSVSKSKTFRVVKDEEEDEKEKSRKKSASLPSRSSAPGASSITSSFSVSVSVENPDHTVFSGDNLLFRLNILKKFASLPNQDYKILYSIVDSEDKIILEKNGTINPAKNPEILKEIEIPRLLSSGRYKIVAKIYQGNNIISGDDFFNVKEFPIFTTGSISITASSLMQNLGWILLILLVILLFFLTLLGIEHHLSNEAVFQVTEKYLAKKGFISKRKGANR